MGISASTTVFLIHCTEKNIFEFIVNSELKSMNEGNYVLMFDDILFINLVAMSTHWLETA